MVGADVEAVGGDELGLDADEVEHPAQIALEVLERAGLIARGRTAQWRPCTLEAGPLKDIADWVEQYRRFWEQSFDRLDDYLKELQGKGKKDGRRK